MPRPGDDGVVERVAKDRGEKETVDGGSERARGPIQDSVAGGADEDELLEEPRDSHGGGHAERGGERAGDEVGGDPDLLPREVLHLGRDVLGTVASPRPRRHTAAQEIQGVDPIFLRERKKVLAELEGRRPGVDTVHHQQRLPLPGDGVGQVLASPPEVARLAADAVDRRSPRLQTAVERREPPDRPRHRQRLSGCRHVPLHSTKLPVAGIVPGLRGVVQSPP